MRYLVVVPVLDQLRYTVQCVDSLLANGTPAEAILVIDNGSSDGTPAWLAEHPEIRSVRNAVNLGCGGAWTQGALLAESEWVVLLNNDVLQRARDRRPARRRRPASARRCQPGARGGRARLRLRGARGRVHPRHGRNVAPRLVPRRLLRG